MSTVNPIGKLDEVKQFLREKQNAPHVQLKILLRPKTTELAKILNGFLNEREMDPEEKLNITIDALGLIADIEQYLPGGELFLTPRMKYAAFGNFLRNTLVSSFSHSNIARNYSSASILSNLLIDRIIHIDELPDFPSYQDPESFNRQFGPVFNIIVSTAGVFTSLISVLPIISQTDIDEWFGHIFKYLKLYQELYNKFNLVALLSSKKSLEPEKILLNAYNVANTQYALIENLIQAYQIYQGSLPQHLLDYGVVEDNSIEAFLDYLNYINGAKDAIAKDIELAKSKRYISMNLDLSNSPFVRGLTNNMRLMETFFLRVNLYRDGLYGQEENLSKYVEKKKELISKYVQHVGSIEDLVHSSMVLDILDQMKDTLPFIALQAVEERDSAILFDFLNNWKLLFDEYSFEKSNEVSIIKLLCEIFVKSKLGKHIDYLQIEDEIDSNLDHVALQPRHFTTMLLIKLIAGQYQGKYIEESSEPVQMLFEIGCPEPESWYKEDLKSYLSYLRGEQGLGELTKRQDLIFLDVYSWLIPDLTKKPLPNGRTIEYLPFNRKSDAIV